MQRFLFIFSFTILLSLTFANVVYAVPPPDFLFNVGSQIAQAFSVVVLFLSAVFSIFYKYIKTKFILIKNRKLVFVTVGVVLILLISGGIAYLYGGFKQDAEYQEWIKESETYSDLSEEEKGAMVGNNGERLEKIKRETDIDKLNLNEKPKISRSQLENQKFVSGVDDDKDASAEFIENYYSNIANQNFEEAYAVSKKSTNLETFKEWYKDVTQITLDDLVRIDEENSSLELTLYEGEKYTRYGVVLTLNLDDGEPISIKNSVVRTLSSGFLADKGDNGTVVNPKTSNFYDEKKGTALSISNKKFQEIINSDRNDYIILDAREDLEYENGQFPDSLHIRYADLQAGRWLELPDDKYIYVLCWSGIRGKEVAEFLKAKGLVASYLENGANGWVDFGGKWIGNIKFAEKYTEEKYKKVFTTEEVRARVQDGAVLVDSREPWKYENDHIAGSVNIPIMHTPTENLEDAFAQVPDGSTVITICDGYVNCFDAKITAVELEERGHTFLGRYNKPWEYE